MARTKHPADSEGILSRETYLQQYCRLYLGDWRNHRPDDDFVNELMTWFVSNVPAKKKLSGPEIARYVDALALSSKTIVEAIDFAAIGLADQFSVEAISKAHARYGKSARTIKLEREKKDISAE